MTPMTPVVLRWFGFSRHSCAHQENHSFLLQHEHLLPTSLEIQGRSCEIWCQFNMLFVLLNVVLSFLETVATSGHL